MPAKIELAIRPVRVSIPASVAGNIKSYKEAIGTVLDRIGCPGCCSGHDFFFELQRDVVLEKGVKDVARPAVASRLEALGPAAKNTLRVGIKPELADDIENVFALLESVADISGHPACATGCDMFFQLESNFVLDARLGLEERAISVANRAGF